MLFQKPDVDVERHVEMRVRRVFPISLESSIKAGYEEALKKLKEATELEKQAYQLTTERAILEHRLSIWDWLGKNFDQLTQSLTSGNLENAKNLIEQIQQEAQRRYQEEQQLLKQVQSGQSVANVLGAPTIVGESYVSSRGYVASQPTQPSGSSQDLIKQRDELLRQLEQQSKQTGQTYAVPAKTFGATGGYYVVTPQGGYSSLVPAPPAPTTYKTLFSPASVPAFNPFQQSGFYNPFR